MMKDLISVIIPVYNVEDYLRKCVDSVLAQTYENLEIILVDDGSPDNCGAICDEYKEKDDRIVVIHKPNGGLSDARNAGLDIANGDYIGFVDSDDFIEKDMFEYLYSILIDNKADISSCEVYNFFTDGKYDIKESSYFSIEGRMDSIKCVLESKVSMHVVTKLCKRSIFDGLRFKVGKNYEDAFIMIDLLDRIDRAVFTDVQKYYYRRREGSISKTISLEHLCDIVEAHDYNFEKVKSIDESLLIPAIARQCWARIVVLDKIAVSNDNDYYETIQKEYIDFLKRNREIILHNDLFTKVRKTLNRVLLMSYFLYRRVIRLSVKRNNNI